MENALVYALLSVGAVSLISLVGVFTLSFNKTFLKSCLFILVALAVGALFGDALIHLLPEAFEASENTATVSFAVVLGILTFFVLEKFLHWHHHHAGHAEGSHSGEELTEYGSPSRVKPLGYLVLTADGVHNLIDGVIIGASYLVSVEVGVATTMAVILHEIPQEIGDFAVLLHSGMTRAKALILNFSTALIAFVGVGAVLLLENIEGAMPFIAAFAAGNFIYIAGSDLLPELHRSKSLSRSLMQFVAIVIGIALMFALLLLE